MSILSNEAKKLVKSAIGQHRKGETRWAEVHAQLDQDGVKWTDLYSPRGVTSLSTRTQEQFDEFKSFIWECYFTPEEAELVATKPSDLDSATAFKRSELIKQPNSVIKDMRNRLKKRQVPKTSTEPRTKPEIALEKAEQVCNALEEHGDEFPQSNVVKALELVKKLVTVLRDKQ